MPTRYKNIEGQWLLDERTTIHEWVKQVGGKFATLVSMEIRDYAPDPFTKELWALVRSENNWEPKWLLVADEVVFSIRELRDFQKMSIEPARVVNFEIWP